MQTTEVFLEDWLILKNSTSTERTGEGKRKKRQAPDSTILTEEHRHGARLTYTCGVARQFKNLTGLYDERWDSCGLLFCCKTCILQVVWVPVGQEVVTFDWVGLLWVGAMYQPSSASPVSQSRLRLPGGELWECRDISQMGLNMISNKGLIIYRSMQL